MENIIAGKDRRGNSNSIYIIRLEASCVCPRERKVNKLLSLVGWEREKLSGLTKEKREGSLSLSFRRTARFKISTCPVNKLLSTGTKQTSKTSNDVSFPLLVQQVLRWPRITSPLSLFFFFFFSSFIENRSRTSTESLTNKYVAHISRTSCIHESAARRNGSSWLRGATLTVPDSPFNWINFELLARIEDRDDYSAHRTINRVSDLNSLKNVPGLDTIYPGNFWISILGDRYRTLSFLRSWINTTHMTSVPKPRKHVQ